MPVNHPPTFHVHGFVRIKTSDGAPVAGADVTFAGGGIQKTVPTDNAGFYEAELPAGAYKMVLNPLRPELAMFERPLFRVVSPASISLDGRVDPLMSCDLLASKGSDHDPTNDEAKEACGGLDHFPVPQDDVAFQLFIYYPQRQRTYRRTVHIGGNLSFRFSWHTTCLHCERHMCSTTSEATSSKPAATSKC